MPPSASGTVPPPPLAPIRLARVRRLARGPLLGAVLLLGLSGCGGSLPPDLETPLEARVAELERENSELRERLAKAERARAREPSADAEPGAGSAAGRGEEAGAASGERPALSVVKLEPPKGAGAPQGGPIGAQEGQAGSGELPPDDAAEIPEGFRPLLRLHGNEEPRLRQVADDKDEPRAAPRSGSGAGGRTGTKS